jgi:hypothetical protein
MFFLSFLHSMFRSWPCFSSYAYAGRRRYVYLISTWSPYKASPSCLCCSADAIFFVRSGRASAARPAREHKKKDGKRGRISREAAPRHNKSNIGNQLTPWGLTWQKNVNEYTMDGIGGVEVRSHLVSDVGALLVRVGTLG